MWFRILSAHWIFPLVTRIFTKATWNQMQFPPALAVTQVNINLRPWKCLYWEKDPTRICGSTAWVQFGCWSMEDIPTVPSMLEWWHGSSAELRAGHLLVPDGVWLFRQHGWECSRTNPGFGWGCPSHHPVLEEGLDWEVLARWDWILLPGSWW